MRWMLVSRPRVVLVTIALLCVLDAVRIIPPEQIARGGTGNVPRPDPVALGSPERTALAERGWYLFSTYCVLCHQADGAGGAKISWRHASNLDDEDVRALIMFLRTLPPIRRKIPDATPPSPDDCATYTFWTVPSLTPGCR